MHDESYQRVELNLDWDVLAKTTRFAIPQVRTPVQFNLEGE
ncbi:hypothetical protein [Bremerella sp. P1]|nr:hypothetical protein [Bremerella sp. P1]WDI45098.1 hypothetical protein PSR63_14260 [Bremerella sp. P1]